VILILFWIDGIVLIFKGNSILWHDKFSDIQVFDDGKYIYIILSGK